MASLQRPAAAWLLARSCQTFQSTIRSPPTTGTFGGPGDAGPPRSPAGRDPSVHDLAGRGVREPAPVGMPAAARHPPTVRAQGDVAAPRVPRGRDPDGTGGEAQDEARPCRLAPDGERPAVLAALRTYGR